MKAIKPFVTRVVNKRWIEINCGTSAARTSLLRRKPWMILHETGTVLSLMCNVVYYDDTCTSIMLYVVILASLLQAQIDIVPRRDLHGLVGGVLDPYQPGCCNVSPPPRITVPPTETPVPISRPSSVMRRKREPVHPIEPEQPKKRRLFKLSELKERDRFHRCFDERVAVHIGTSGYNYNNWHRGNCHDDGDGDGDV